MNTRQGWGLFDSQWHLTQKGKRAYRDLKIVISGLGTSIGALWYITNVFGDGHNHITCHTTYWKEGYTTTSCDGPSAQDEANSIMANIRTGNLISPNNYHNDVNIALLAFGAGMTIACAGLVDGAMTIIDHHYDEGNTGSRNPV